MTWYGKNRSGRLERWKVGDIVRYDDGETALMRIVSVREIGEDPRGIGCAVRYYGQAFHDQTHPNGEPRASVGRYHGQCLEPTEEDRACWARCHDDHDNWIRGAWS